MSRSVRSRYVVGVPNCRTLYEGNSKFIAWCYWLANRREAKAFDRRTWILDPSYWLSGDRASTFEADDKGE